MMNEYTLYLDESLSFKCSGTDRHDVFCMAGIVINNNILVDLEKEFSIMKSHLWPSFPNSNNIILHQCEINNTIRGRASRPEYRIFANRGNCRYVYDSLNTIYNLYDIKVIGATVDVNRLSQFYSNGNTVDKYLISLQLILENYNIFLCNCNGHGSITYESRGFVEDERMRQRFYQIKIMGSMYINAMTMSKRLGTINFKNKNENDVGLQLADFVPNYFARKELGLNFENYQRDYINSLRQSQYDGGLNLRHRYGIKTMP